MPRTLSKLSICRFALASVLLILCVVEISAERLPLRIYTTADGLATSAAFNVVRDARGFIWICSRDGLVRFDGYRFINYRIGDGNADPAVYDLFTTRLGDYWVNLNRGTDYKFSSQSDDRVIGPFPKASDLRVPLPAEPTTGLVFPRFEDDDGQLWTADSNGLYKVTREGATTETFPIELPGNPTGILAFTDFRDAREGDGFWIGTNWGVVRRFPDGRMVHTAVDPEGNSDVVRPFAEDAEGRLWVVRQNSLVVMKTLPSYSMTANGRASVAPGKIAEDGSALLPETPGTALRFELSEIFHAFSTPEKLAKGMAQPVIASIFVDSVGNVWLPSTQGLAKFDGKRFHHYTTHNGLAMNEAAAITEGIDGSLWFLSYGGLHRLNPNGLTSFDEYDGIDRGRIHNIQENIAGELVVVSGNFNVSTFDGRKFRSARPNVPAEETYAWQSSAGFLDSRGDLWLHSNKKLYRFKDVKDVSNLAGRSPDAVYDDQNGLLGGNVIKTFEDSKGVLWFSCFQSAEKRGITRLDPATGEFRSYTAKDGLPGGAVATGFAEDADGSLWFGFIEGGLARFRNGEFTKVTGESAPAGGITHMFRDSKGRIWVSGNRDGLVLIENSTAEQPTFRRFTTSEGLTSNNVRCVTDDAFGNIYVGTVRGVNRLSPDTGQVAYYGPADGLASDFVSSIYRDRAGNIWIGTFNGISRLTPQPDRSTDPPGILISALRIGGENYAISPIGQSEVHLPDQESGRGNIQIEFLSAGSNFSTPARYQYRLDPSGEWSQPSIEPTVNFANLPAGSFRFEVRAVNERGVVSTVPAFVHFNVLRPVWQRWWFLLIAAATLAALAYFVYRLRLAQAVKLERIRTRIASDLHDDIGSSLSQIAILSEVARQKAGENGASEPLRRIADTSREMVDSMSDIVWAINPQKDTLGDLVSRMRRFAEETFDATEIGYKFDFDESLASVALGTDTRRDAYLIFKEAVNNIIKHAGAETVNIRVESAGGTVNFSILDDGVGYSEPEDPEQTFPGFGGNGLINMRRRAEQRGGDFKFTSGPGAGTKVEFSLPLKAGKIALF